MQFCEMVVRRDIFLSPFQHDVRWSMQFRADRASATACFATIVSADTMGLVLVILNMNLFLVET